MRKNLKIFIILYFLCAQIASFIHISDHDFSPHEHNNQNCQIYAGQKDFLDPLLANITFFPVMRGIFKEFSRDKSPDLSIFLAYASRAPPIFS